MKSFVLPLTFALFGFGAIASAEETHSAAATPTTPAASDASCHCDPCNCFLSSLHHEDFYSDISGSYIQANHFNGWGITGRLGRWINRDETQKLEGTGHAVELEVNFFAEDYDRSVTQYVYDTGVSQTAPLLDTSSTYQGKVVQNRSADVTMVPILIAWRYHGSMAGWTDWDFMEKMRWYAGAGLGLNICHTKNYATNSIYDSTGALAGKSYFRDNHTSLLPVAELAGGIGYAMSERCEIFGGLRALATDSRKFSSGTITGMKCPKLHVVYDLGMRFQW